MSEKIDRAAGLPHRKKETRRSVIIADRIADWTITVGGLFVILAVFGIMAFLAQVVVPLFTGGHLEGRVTHPLARADAVALSVSTDDYMTLGLKIGQAGTVQVFHLATGKPLQGLAYDFGGATVTGFGRSPKREDVAFGFADGTVRFGQVRMAVQVLPADQLPAGLTRLDDRDSTDGKAVYSRIAGNQIRRIVPEVALDPATKVADDGSAIVALDVRVGGTVERPVRSFVSVDANGIARLSTTESRVNMLTRQVRTDTRTATLPGLPAGTKVKSVLMTEKADQVYVGDPGGTIYRFDTRDFAKPVLAEAVDLLG
ncbi:MAG: ABC transporter permease, partial [Alphaproteobacteria bacterium]